MAAAAVDARMGERARRISCRLCASRNLLDQCGLAMVGLPGRSLRRRSAKHSGREARSSPGVHRPVKRVGNVRESLRLETARSHLSLSFQSLPDGSHRRVSIAEFSRCRTEVLCGVAAAHVGGIGSEETGKRDTPEPIPGGSFCRIFRPVCFAEYTGVVPALDSGDGTVVVGCDGKACGGI